MRSEEWRLHTLLQLYYFFFINCKYTIFYKLQVYIYIMYARTLYIQCCSRRVRFSNYRTKICRVHHRASSGESGTRTRTLYSRGFSGFPLGLCHCHIFQLRQLVYSLYTFCLARRSYTSPIQPASTQRFPFYALKLMFLPL